MSKPVKNVYSCHVERSEASLSICRVRATAVWTAPLRAFKQLALTGRKRALTSTSLRGRTDPDGSKTKKQEVAAATAGTAQNYATKSQQTLSRGRRAGGSHQGLQPS